MHFFSRTTVIYSEWLNWHNILTTWKSNFYFIIFHNFFLAKVGILTWNHGVKQPTLKFVLKMCVQNRALLPCSVPYGDLRVKCSWGARCKWSNAAADFGHGDFSIASNPSNAILRRDLWMRDVDTSLGFSVQFLRAPNTFYALFYACTVIGPCPVIGPLVILRITTNSQEPNPKLTLKY